MQRSCTALFIIVASWQHAGTHHARKEKALQIVQQLKLRW